MLIKERFLFWAIGSDRRFIRVGDKVAIDGGPEEHEVVGIAVEQGASRLVVRDELFGWPIIVDPKRAVRL